MVSKLTDIFDPNELDLALLNNHHILQGTLFLFH